MGLEDSGLLYLDEFGREHGADGVLATSERMSEEGCVARVERVYRNVSGRAVRLVPAAAFFRRGELHSSLIPCVSYNGNRWGTGMEPKGLACEGRPWIFPGDRTGVPGCTIAESPKSAGKAGLCTALFAGFDAVSKDCSCSLLADEGRVEHRLYFARIEAPKSYATKFSYAPETRALRTLAPGETFLATFYLYAAPAVIPYYGYIELYRYVFDRLSPPPVPAPDPGRLCELDLQFLLRLAERREDGRVLTNMGLLPDGEHMPGGPGKRFVFRKFGKYESGWCGQNLSNALLFVRTGVPALVRLGRDIADTWLETRRDNGLLSCHFDDFLAGNEEELLDTCNLGWSAVRYFGLYRQLKEARYLTAAVGVLEFFLARFAPARGFPQTLNLRGEVKNDRGMAGVMLILALLDGEEATGREDFLTAAEEAFHFYYNRYLARSAASGAALDSFCVDKESAGPMLQAALRLAARRGENYLDLAERIAYYLETWMFHYDLDFAPDTDAARLSLRTLGGTAVSAQHQHLDDWAMNYIPALAELGALRDARWQRMADCLWGYATQVVSDGTWDLHGMRRPPGGQNEGFYHCGWSDPKGSLNDWLVCWVKAAQLEVLAGKLSAAEFRRRAEAALTAVRQSGEEVPE